MDLRIALLIVPLVLAAGEVVEFRVAPGGDDAADSSLAHPLASLRGARDVVRRLRSGGAIGSARVVLADGTYRLGEALVLEVQDGDTVWQAAPGARPVISGGVAITGFTVGAEGVWTVRIPAANLRFEQLYVDAAMAQRARSPDRGWGFLRSVREDVIEPGGKVAKVARQTVGLAPDLLAALRGLGPDDLHDAQLVVYHNWDVTRRGIATCDPASGGITTVGGGMKPWNPWKAGSPCVIENSRAACDSPGEWFLGRDGVLLYRPLPGQDPARTAVIAPVADTLLAIHGDAAGRPVEGLSFRGLTFRHARWQCPAGGQEPVQAAASVPAAIMVDDARGIRFEDCDVSQVGGYGMWFRTGCGDAVVRRCHLHDLGGGGVRIGETVAVQEGGRATARITVDDCIIRHGGLVHPSAVGVLIGAASDCSVTRNEIADLWYSGVSAGWRWGYEPSSAKRNTIRGNHIHHIGKGLLSDMGGVYTLGPSEGTVVAGNLIHDVVSRTYGGWGLYTDEGSSGITIEDNVVHRTTDGSFHQHFGRDNVVRNNILADSGRRQVVVTRAEPHRSFTFEHNIVWWSTGPALSGPWDKAITVTGGNCWFNAAGSAVDFLGHPLAEWQGAGHEAGSVVADPQFADPGRGDFTVRPGSPAIAAGFRPFVVQAGVYGDPAWVALAAEPVAAAPAVPQPAISEGFEEQVVGKPPSGVELHVEGAGDAIVVDDSTAAEGRRSLRITDAAGLRNSWDPHLVWQVRHVAGTVENAFWLRVEQASVVDWEWRDWDSTPYATGAALAIRGCRLQLPGGTGLDLPERQWVRFAITGEVGAGNPGTWSLAVTLPGQQPRTFAGLRYRSPQFHILTWVGCVSGATVATTFHLDGVGLTGR